MNCKTVEKLLPLYVEGDMMGAESVGVRVHLSSCVDCFQLSEEFRASQARLHNFAAPDFGAEFYEQIRGNVLAEITARRPAGPSFIDQLRQLFAWRPALAVSFALLFLACGAIAYSLYSALQRGDATLAAMEEGMGGFNLEIKDGDGPPAVEAPKKESPVARREPAPAAGNSARRMQTGRQPSAVPDGTAPEKNAAASTNDTVAASAMAEPPKEENVTEETGQAIARMEIQTSDPNIRIIWLAPKKGE